jgi:hypothetical protein
MPRTGFALALPAAFGLALLPLHAVEAAPLPTVVGTCAETNIEEIGTRLGTPESGSVVSFVNGGVQISYDPVSGIINSQVGDPVNVCLVFVPQDCPPGDDRGKIYRTTNLRTGESWELPDSQHSCGGA